MGLIWLIPLSGVLSLCFVAYLGWDILRSDAATPEMRAVGAMVFEGAAYRAPGFVDHECISTHDR